MAVRKGYKMTEVGVIPEDWEVSKFDDFGHWKGGGTPSKSIDAYWNGKIPWLSPKDIKSSLISNSINSITRLGLKNSSSNLARIGSVLIVTRSGVLRHTFPVAQIRKSPMAVNQDIKFLEPESTFEIDFIRYQIERSEFMLLKECVKVGTTVESVDMNNFKKFQIPLPPTLTEQRVIATALGETDAWIRSLEALVAKKRLVKEGVMRELLTPGEGWKEVTLSEITGNSKANFNDGDWIEKEHIKKSGIRLIQTGNIGVGKFTETSRKKFISEFSFDSLKCKEVEVGDLLICRLAAPAGRACVMPNINASKIITSVDVTIVKPLRHLADKYFLVQLFSTNDWLEDISNNSGGTTHKRISRSNLGSIPFKIPSLPQQTKIAQTLSTLDEEITALETRLAKARAIKAGMMENLLTGKIRLL